MQNFIITVLPCLPGVLIGRFLIRNNFKSFLKSSALCFFTSFIIETLYNVSGIALKIHYRFTGYDEFGLGNGLLSVLIMISDFFSCIIGTVFAGSVSLYKQNEKKRNDFMYEKSLTHHIAKIMIDVLFYLNIAALVTVPFWAKSLFILIDETGEFPLFELIIFLSGACCLYILFNLKQMYCTLLSGNPFIDKNVSHLRKMAVACFAVFLIYLAKCIIMFTFATLVITIIFLVGCLFCLTLKDLFKQAINYKTENDLTI